MSFRSPFQFRFEQLEPWLLEECHAFNVLLDLGFVPAPPFGLLKATFGRLEVYAGHDITPDTCTLGVGEVPRVPGGPMPREMIAPDDIRIIAWARRIDHLLFIGDVIRTRTDDKCLPAACREARVVWQSELKRRDEYKRATTIWAEREFLRLCVRRVLAHSKAGNPPDSAPALAQCRLSHQNEILRLSVGGIDLPCPARGRWPAEVLVRTDNLLGATQQRFMQREVEMQIDGQNLLIDNRRVPIIEK